MNQDLKKKGKLIRRREDDYIQQFHPEDRPVLLIKKKDAFLGVENSEMFENPDHKEEYYKISENTTPVEDINDEIMNQQAFIKKQTYVHQAKRPLKDQDQQNDNSIYKIQGIEFLPEGFLELDPLLYQNQFEFENHLQKKLFDHEQRKVKQLRRKQYQQRNQQKMRDVTIYVLDEHKDKVIDYLEKFYFKNKRRMNNKEIEYVSELLQCEKNTLKDLQELFLKRQQYLNTKELRKYLMKHGRLINNKLTVPESLKKYFVKINNPYDYVQPRVYDSKNVYNSKQRFIKPKLKKAFSSRIKPYPSNPYDDREKFKNKIFTNNNEQDNIFNQPSNNQKKKSLKFTNKRMNRTQTAKYPNTINTHEGMFSPERQFDMNQSVPVDFKYQVYQKNSVKSQDNLKNYFDSEVNNILTKIQNINPKQSINDAPTQDSFLINEPVKRPSQNLVRRKTSRSKKSSGKIKPKASLASQRRKKSSNLSKKQSLNKKLSKKSTLKPKKSKKESKIEYYPEMDTFGKETQNPNPSLLHSGVNDEFNRISVSVSKINPSQYEKRLTLSFKNEKGNQIVYHKLKPLLIGNQLYFQTIKEEQFEDGRIESVLTTKNNINQIIEEFELDQEQIGEFYTNELICKAPEFEGEQKNLIIVKNDRLETISVIPIKNTNPTLFGVDQDQRRLTTANFQNPLILRKKNNTIHCLQPLSILGDYYQQIVTELINQKGRQVTIVTKNNDGIILSKDVVQIPRQTLGNYYTHIVNEIINERGQKEFCLETRDEEGDILASHIVKGIYDSILNDYQKDLMERARKTTIQTKKKNGKIIRSHSVQPVIVGKEYFKQDVEEIIDNKGNRSVTVITKNQYGQIVAKNEISPDFFTQGFVSEIIQDTQSINGESQITIMTKNERGESVSLVSVRPTIFQVLGENYFDQSEYSFKPRKSLQIIQEETEDDNSTVVHALRPTIIGNQYYQQIIEELVEEGQKKVSLITKNKEGEKISILQIPPNIFQGKEFETEVGDISKDFTSMVLSTKNDKGKVLATQVIRPQSKHPKLSMFNVKMLEEMNNKSKSMIFLTQRQNHKLKTILLKPSIVGNEYYYQIIDEIMNDNNEIQSVRLTTKNQDGGIISIVELPPDSIVGNVFETQIKQGQDSIIMITVDQNSNIIQNQRIKPTIFSVIGENYFDDFEKYSNNGESILNIQNRNGTVIKSHILRPTKIGDSYYQQIIDEIIDLDGNKTVIVKTLNQNKELIEVEEIDPTMEIDLDLYTELKTNLSQTRRGVTVVIKNAKGEEIAQQMIYPDQRDQSKYNATQLLSKKKTTVQQGKKTISHQLRPTLIGNQYYDILLEEIFEENGNKKLTVIANDIDGNVIHKNTLNSKLTGNNYQTSILKDFVDSNNQRNVTIQILNDQGQSIEVMRLQPFDYEKPVETLYDNLKLNEFFRNETQVKQDKNQSFVIKKLRSTQIGARSYNFMFIEKKDSQGNARLTFIAENQEGKQIYEEELDPSLIGENYFAQVSTLDVGNQEEKVAEVNITNNKNQTVISKRFKTSMMADISFYNFDDFLDIFDESGNRTSTIAVKKSVRKTFQHHMIRPTLIGNEYYHQVINEIVDQAGNRKATLLTINERGSIVDMQEINDKLIADYYETICADISVDSQNQRYSVLETFNNKNQLVARTTIKPNLNNLIEQNYNEIIEDLIDQQDNCKRTILQKNEGGEFVIKNEIIPEEKRSSSFNMNLFNNLLERFPQDQSENRKTFPVNYNQRNQEPKKSFSPLQREPKFSQMQNDFDDGIIIDDEGEDDYQPVNKQSQNIINIINQEFMPKDERNSQMFKKQKKKSYQFQNDRKSYDIRQNFEDEEEGEDYLIQKSKRLQGYLNDYISTLNDSRKKAQNLKEQQKQQDFLKDTIEKVFEKEKEKLSEDIIKKLENKKANSGLNPNLMDEFYDFCREQLPHDQKYKESIMLVSLFYYFLEKKKLIVK